MIQFSSIRLFLIQFLALGLLMVFSAQVLNEDVFDFTEKEEMVDIDIDDTDDTEEDEEEDEVDESTFFHSSSRIHFLLTSCQLEFESNYSKLEFTIESPPPEKA